MVYIFCTEPFIVYWWYLCKELTYDTMLTTDRDRNDVYDDDGEHHSSKSDRQRNHALAPSTASPHDHKEKVIICNTKVYGVCMPKTDSIPAMREIAKVYTKGRRNEVQPKYKYLLSALDKYEKSSPLLRDKLAMAGINTVISLRPQYAEGLVLLHMAVVHDRRALDVMDDEPWLKRCDETKSKKCFTWAVVM